MLYLILPISIIQYLWVTNYPSHVQVVYKTICISLNFSLKHGQKNQEKNERMKNSRLWLIYNIKVYNDP